MIDRPHGEGDGTDPALHHTEVEVVIAGADLQFTADRDGATVAIRGTLHGGATALTHAADHVRRGGTACTS